MSSELTLRDATRDEVPAIVAMLTDDDLGRTRETTENLDPYYRAFDSLDANNRVLVAELDGVIVGTLQLTLIPGLSLGGSKRAQIEAVRVAADHRGRGLGEQMFRLAIEIASQEECALVQLTTNKVRTDAHRFYERLGFEATHDGFKLSLNN